jgi:hypothetical protein
MVPPQCIYLYTENKPCPTICPTDLMFIYVYICLFYGTIDLYNLACIVQYKKYATKLRWATTNKYNIISEITCTLKNLNFHFLI